MGWGWVGVGLGCVFYDRNMKKPPSFVQLTFNTIASLRNRFIQKVIRYRLCTFFIFRGESHMCLDWVGEVTGRLISQAYPVLVIIPKIKSQSTSREVVSE